MLDVRCQCGTQFQLGDEWGGKQGRCPACGAVLVIPRTARGGEATSSPSRRVIPPASVDLPETAPMDFSPTPDAGLQGASADRPRLADVPCLPLASSALHKEESGDGARTQRVVPHVRYAWLAGLVAWPRIAWIAAGVAVALGSVVGVKLAPRPHAEITPSRVAPAIDGGDQELPKVGEASAEDDAEPAAAPRPDDIPLDGAGQPALSVPIKAKALSTGQPAASSPKRPRPMSSSGLESVSREYDDLHCQTIQASHAVRIPAAASIIEVNGQRLPIANSNALAAAHSPFLFLPRGEHVVRFGPDETLVEVKIAGDLASEYWAMQAYFDVAGTVHEHDLLSRAAGAMDVHGTPFLLNFMGVTHAGRDQWSAAERKFRRALRVNPAFTPAHLNLAQCLARREAREEAAREVRLAEAFNVGNVFGLNKAIVEFQSRLDIPLDDRQLIEFDPAAYVAADAGSLSDGDRWMTALLQGVSKFAQREEERAKLLNKLAVHFADRGQVEQALEHFRDALAELKFAGPDQFEFARQVLANMGDACRKAGFEEADEYQQMQGLLAP